MWAGIFIDGYLVMVICNRRVKRSLLKWSLGPWRAGLRAFALGLGLVALSSEAAPPVIAAPSMGPQGEELRPDPRAEMAARAALKRQREWRGPYGLGAPELPGKVDSFDHRQAADRARADRAKRCLPPNCHFDPSQIIVKLRPNVSPATIRSQARAAAETDPAKRLLNGAQLENVFAKVPAQVLERGNAKARAGGARNAYGKLIDLTRWYALPVPEGEDIDAAVEALMLDERIELAERHYQRSTNGAVSSSGNSVSQAILPTPNDPRATEQWHISATNTDQAWQWLEDNGYPAYGDRNIVVAVIDTGVDYTHEDLAGNMWVNQAEIPGNGIDDDANGFVDDIHGANVVGDPRFHSGDPQDDNGHGTHVAGIIGAQGNNGIGVIGVAPNVQIMAIKAAQFSGLLTTTDIAEGILYAFQQGADVINMSFGGTGLSVIEEEALGVAFSQSVLVAAAGNNGLWNDAICSSTPPTPFFPASLTYVLGVMAERPSADANGSWLAGFSNWDCAPLTLREYDVMAPGVDILSLLPNNNYAAWDGTSMAAPVVAGHAALFRTAYPDKAAYSSRFIMGQIASANPKKRLIRQTPDKVYDLQVSHADALVTLTNTPAPDVYYSQFWLLDDETLSVDNNNDGVIDAGESIALGIEIGNKWGAATEVTVTATAESAAGLPDPYVSWVTQTVSIGDIGSFTTSDNGIVTDGSTNPPTFTIADPVLFSVAPDAPNDHVIPVTLTITARNGLDSSDLGTYRSTSQINLVVRSGTILPSIIDAAQEDVAAGGIDTDGVVDGVVMLDSSRLWIVAQPTLIASGTTLRVGPGAVVEWRPEESLSAFSEEREPFLELQGMLDVRGSETSPAILRPTDTLESWAVYLTNPQMDPARVNISYAIVRNLVVSGSPSTSSQAPLGNFDHVVYDRPESVFYGSVSSKREYRGDSHTSMRFSNSSIQYRPGRYSIGFGYSADRGGEFDRCLFYGSRISFNSSGNYFPVRFLNSAFLDNDSVEYPPFKGVPFLTGSSDNAILNVTYEPDLGRWFRVRPYSSTEPSDLSSNYWGAGSNLELAELTVFDASDNFNLQRAILDPVLETPPATAYPFVADVQITDASGATPADGRFSPGTTTWTVSFIRPMDQTVQPFVAFGPAEPYSDFLVNGDWVSPTEWVGTAQISPLASEGYQYVRVQGAVAADDAWLVTGNDTARFRFEVVRSGVESLNLQATGGEGFVDLTWSQNDYDTLQGFNIYRSTAPDTGFVRINQTLVADGERSYRDDSVAPGQQYYYYFTVMFDGSESAPSNTASAVPIDTVPPALTHVPIASAPYGSSVLLQANATDNIAVASVTAYYRAVGSGTYTELPLVNLTGNSYRASIPGSAMLPPGVEYYIAASDGASVAFSGRASAPYTIAVSDAPVITAISPTSGASGGGDTVIVSGNNFQAGAKAFLGDAPCEGLVVESSSRLTCTTPASIPQTVALSVENPSGARTTAPNAFTYIGVGNTSLALPDIEGTTGQTLDAALSIGDVAGLQSFSARLTWDPTHLELATVRKGALIPGWNLDWSESTPGTLTLAASSSTPLSGTGDLAVLEFSVLAADAAASPLTITTARLNDGAIAASAVPGTFTWFSGFNITGQVTFRDAARTPLAATVFLDGMRTAFTDGATGAFAFGGVPQGQHTVTASKSDGINASIRVFDASLVLSHVVGTATLTGDALVAADVTGNGEVTEQDAAKILEVADGLRGVPFQNQTSPWAFVPDSLRIDDLTADATGQDFRGVFIGDVSGNWPDIEQGVAPAAGSVTSTQALSSAMQSAPASLVSLVPLWKNEAGNVVVAVSVDPTAAPAIGQGVSAFEMELTLSSGATLVSANRTSATESWSTPRVLQQNGLWTLSLFDDVSGAFDTLNEPLILEMMVADDAQMIIAASGWVNETPYAISDVPLQAEPRPERPIPFPTIGALALLGGLGALGWRRARGLSAKASRKHNVGRDLPG